MLLVDCEAHGAMSINLGKYMGRKTVVARHAHLGIEVEGGDISKYYENDRYQCRINSFFGLLRLIMILLKQFSDNPYQRGME